MNPFKNRKQRRAEAAVAPELPNNLQEIQDLFNQKAFQLGNLFYQAGMVNGQLQRLNIEIEKTTKEMETLSLKGHDLKQAAVKEEIAKGPKEQDAAVQSKA